MRRTIERLKTITLILAMALGFWVQGPRAHAQAHETLVVAGGCFWCVEADFEKLPGVLGVLSGYTGGQLANPTYKQVTAARHNQCFAGLGMGAWALHPKPQGHGQDQRDGFQNIDGLAHLTLRYLVQHAWHSVVWPVADMICHASLSRGEHLPPAKVSR